MHIYALGDTKNGFFFSASNDLNRHKSASPIMNSANGRREDDIDEPPPDFNDVDDLDPELEY
jgi:hypothetical protein